jgi:predicted N-formylglutamate amidohydrolase
MFERLVVTCEHATNRIPSAFRGRFADADGVLRSHRGHDPGALSVARILAARLGAPLEAGRVSRLLVDLNRSDGHPRLFSTYLRDLDPPGKQAILDCYYRPYRAAVAAALVAESSAGRRVLHTSIHSFVPVLGGVARNADIGILYDPARRIERAAADALVAHLRDGAAVRVRRNYPYRGTSDGLTTALRKEPWASRYAGIEIELNQARLRSPGARRRMARRLEEAIRPLVAG